MIMIMIMIMIRFSQSHNDIRGPPPTLGQHTDAVLQVRDDISDDSDVCDVCDV